MPKPKTDWSSMRVKKLLEEARFLLGQKRSIEELISNKKKRLSAYFEETGNDKCSTEHITAFVQSRTKVDYDVEAIKKALDRSVWKRFVRTVYTLKKKEFVDVCKENGIDPKLFSCCFEKTQNVDENALSGLYEKGVLSLADLEGCYDAEVTKTVILRERRANSYSICEG